MSSCGCSSGGEDSCGCNVVAGDETVQVGRSGNTFVITAHPPLMSTADTTCIRLEVDSNGRITASPIIDPDVGTVQLDCGEDGLRANLRVDPMGSLPVTQTEAGLRFDCCTVEASQFRRPGDIFHSGALSVPSDTYELQGQLVARAGDEPLFDALSVLSTVGRVISSDNQVTDLATTDYVQVGMTVEVDGFAGNPTVVSKTATSLTLSTNAFATFPNTATVRVFVYGTPPNPATHFYLPGDARHRVLAGVGLSGPIADPQAAILGGIMGDDAVTLTAGMMAAHGHALLGSVTATQEEHGHVTDAHDHINPGSPWSGRTATAEEAADAGNPAFAGTHGHAAPDNADIPGGEKGRHFVTVAKAGITNVGVNNTGAGAQHSMKVGAVTPGESLGFDDGQGSTEFTAPTTLNMRVILNTEPGLATSTVAPAISVSNTLSVGDSAGATEQAPVVQPTLFVRTLIQR